MLMVGSWEKSGYGRKLGKSGYGRKLGKMVIVGS